LLVAAEGLALLVQMEHRAVAVMEVMAQLLQ
jgi:hypothetical protein